MFEEYWVPSRELTYPTLGKRNIIIKSELGWDMLNFLHASYTPQKLNMEPENASGKERETHLETNHQFGGLHFFNFRGVYDRFQMSYNCFYWVTYFNNP